MNNSTFRSGDRVSIPGSYQYDALTEGNAVQRFWHFNKQLVIEQYLPPQASDRIIDVGCGSGVVSEFLAKSGAEVLGIDGNADAISFASEKFQRQNLSFRKGLVDSQFEAEEPFDKIYCLEVLEHIYYDQGRQMLANFHRALRPEGAVFLTTPNYRSFWPLIECCWTVHDWFLILLRISTSSITTEESFANWPRRQDLQWIASLRRVSSPLGLRP